MFTSFSQALDEKDEPSNDSAMIGCGCLYPHPIRQLSLASALAAPEIRPTA
jgi:hypothetical protein